MASEQYFCSTCGGPGEHVVLGDGDCVSCKKYALDRFQTGTVRGRRKCILQDWVMELGLRHQGVLLTVVRGCDTAPKHDRSKLFTRCIRDMILNPHCGDATKAATFIERVTTGVLLQRFHDFRTNLDHYPHHYVMHIVHALEIIGYYAPGQVNWREKPGDEYPVVPMWEYFYLKLCHALHMNPETREQLDARLNADEETFAKLDRA